MLDESDKEILNLSFNSDDSYEPLTIGGPILRRRPTNVPALFLEGLPEYESSSSEGDPESH